MADDHAARAEDAALTSVAAHGMLNSLGVARATISTLRLHWARLDEETCLRLLRRAEEQLVFLGETLGDLVRGIPAEARQFLDGLDDARIDLDNPQMEAPPADR
jgi:hypothetical protein